MKLVCKKIQKTFDINENKISVCIIENPSFFSYLILTLKNQIDNNQEGEFSLYDNLEELNLSKSILLITDLFNFDFNNKKFITAIYNELKEYIREDSNSIEIENSLFLFFQNISQRFPFPLDMNKNCNYEYLFKGFNIHVEENYDNYLEKIIDYLTICSELKLMKVVIFVNLKTILTEEECIKLYRECFYKKIPIFLFENRENNSIMDLEEKVIIDFDLCEIY